MMHRKGVSGLIVMIVLLVLIFSFVIWVGTVFLGNVSKGAGKVNRATLCAGIELMPQQCTIDSATQRVAFKVQRGGDDSDLKAMTFVLEDLGGIRKVMRNYEIVPAQEVVPVGMQKSYEIPYSSIPSSVEVGAVLIDKEGREVLCDLYPIRAQCTVS